LLSSEKHMSRKTMLVAAIALIVIVAVGGGYAGWTYLGASKPSATPTPSVTPTPPLAIAAQARDAAMNYMASNHAETAQLMSGFSWTGGRQPTELVGSETYVYMSVGWTVKVEYPVVPNPTFTVSANFSQSDEKVTWRGTYQNSAITETSYSSDNLQPVASVATQTRDDVMLFIANRHNNDVATLLTTLYWTGGRITPAGAVGFETYNFTAAQSGWNVVIQYPVVASPTIQVNATCVSPISHQTLVVWQGTWQNGVINEISYRFGS
jgi:hypothetical protein